MDRAAQIQALLREGLTQREVCSRLRISRTTVNQYKPLDLPKRERAKPVRSGRVAATEFPVHPDVVAAKMELLAQFDSLGDIGVARAKLASLLRKHHPRENRHPDQLEPVKVNDVMTDVASHDPVYKRIAIGPEPAPRPALMPTAYKPEAHKVDAEQASKIWDFVVQTSRGTNLARATEPSNDDLDLIAFAKTGGPPQD